MQQHDCLHGEVFENVGRQVAGRRVTDCLICTRCCQRRSRPRSASTRRFAGYAITRRSTDGDSCALALDQKRSVASLAKEVGVAEQTIYLDRLPEPRRNLRIQKALLTMTRPTDSTAGDQGTRFSSHSPWHGKPRTAGS
jgi:hypothetical protein